MAVDIDEGGHRDNGGRGWDVVGTSIGKAVTSAIDEREERAAEGKREKEERDLAAAVDGVVPALERNSAGLTMSRLRDGLTPFLTPGRRSLRSTCRCVPMTATRRRDSFCSVVVGWAYR